MERLFKFISEKYNVIPDIHIHIFCKFLSYFNALWFNNK
jgi:hypothetical protein